MCFRLQLSLLSIFISSVNVNALKIDLYLTKDKFGEYYKLDINEKGCTNVPLNWENQAESIDTHGSCVKLYDMPYCRGKYVAIQAYHETFQDNLSLLKFNKLISSVSPCGPQIPTGRYYIQNGDDGSVLTVESKNGTVRSTTKPFQPYISKGQQFEVQKISVADYEIVPRAHSNLNPITFDMRLSSETHPIRRTWKLESVYRGRYLIKNEWSNHCLYKTEDGKVSEHDCVPWSPNQEWMFRSIKVKPFFPSKQEMKNKPLPPDSPFLLDTLDEKDFIIPNADLLQKNPQYPMGLKHINQLWPHPRRPVGAFSPAIRPSVIGKVSFETKRVTQKKNSEGKLRPNRYQVKGKEKHSAEKIPFNPNEPFPPVVPAPIYQWPTLVSGAKKGGSIAPVPIVRHPGQFPFPPEPVITAPKNGKKPISVQIVPNQVINYLRPPYEPNLPKSTNRKKGNDDSHKEDGSGSAEKKNGPSSSEEDSDESENEDNREEGIVYDQSNSEETAFDKPERKPIQRVFNRFNFRPYFGGVYQPETPEPKRSRESEESISFESIESTEEREDREEPDEVGNDYDVEQNKVDHETEYDYDEAKSESIGDIDEMEFEKGENEDRTKAYRDGPHRNNQMYYFYQDPHYYQHGNPKQQKKKYSDFRIYL